MLLDPGREVLLQVLGSKTQYPVHGVGVKGREFGHDVNGKSSLEALSSDLGLSSGVHTPEELVCDGLKNGVGQPVLEAVHQIPIPLQLQKKEKHERGHWDGRTNGKGIEVF